MLKISYVDIIDHRQFGTIKNNIAVVRPTNLAKEKHFIWRGFLEFRPYINRIRNQFYKPVTLNVSTSNPSNWIISESRAAYASKSRYLKIRTLQHPVKILVNIFICCRYH